MEFGKSSWRTFEEGIQKEWLLTNGIGGFASSTILSANTRRYHGLLVASLNPPVQRNLILSGILETIMIGQNSYPLSTFQTTDFTMTGFHHLQRVVIDPLPCFEYRVEEVFIDKRISMIYGENTVAITYHVINGKEPCRLTLSPLTNYRDYHGDSKSEFMGFKHTYTGESLNIQAYENTPPISIYCSEGEFVSHTDCYFYNMAYAQEKERGLQACEDHYIPGKFEITILPYEEKKITLIATIEKRYSEVRGDKILKAEKRRLDALIDLAGHKDEFAKRLVIAADQFIVYRKSTDAKTILAGYPWFTDWGRDTMIAFAGITLVTGRFQDARDILYSFSKYIKNGLVPNVFPDAGLEPLYNTVDAGLWYFEAVKKFLDYTKDGEYIQEHLYKGLKEIIRAYKEGTDFKIKMQEDYLISAGDEGTQLTWMDAKVGDWVVTPRHGKAVEINALWYNALKIMSELALRFEDREEDYNKLAIEVKASFVQGFWNEDEQCLYDVIREDYKDDSVRPNQIIAASLSYPVITGDLAKKVVDKVWKELYAVYGLRSLSAQSKEYRGVYRGDQWSRDGAYHQGTIWSWPLGHFITAYVKANAYSKESKKIAQKMIGHLADHMKDACVGSISEIFDGDDPMRPRGCFAQAWGVGEILRTYIEDIKE